MELLDKYFRQPKANEGKFKNHIRVYWNFDTTLMDPD